MKLRDISEAEFGHIGGELTNVKRQSGPIEVVTGEHEDQGTVF